MCGVRSQKVSVEIDVDGADVIAWRVAGYDQNGALVMWYEESPGPFEQVQARVDMAGAVGRTLGALWFSATHTVVVE